MFKRKLQPFINRYKERKKELIPLCKKWIEQGYEKHVKSIEEAMWSIDALLEEYKDQEKVPSSVMKKLSLSYRVLADAQKSNTRWWIEQFGFSFIAAVFFKNFVFGLFHVPSGSAEPCLLVGDRLIGNMSAYCFSKPAYKDQVIFDDPRFVYDKSLIQYLWQKYVGLGVPLLGLKSGPEKWTKRLIAGPGDTIEGRVENGKTVVYKNGLLLPEPYTNPFPLIYLKKRIGLLPASWVPEVPLLSSFAVREKYDFYTYDPKRPFYNQPCYGFTAEEVVYDLSQQPIFRYPKTPGEHDVFGPITLPEGKYWVMGDNRKHSEDSRKWLFLDISRIRGRASRIIFSLDSIEEFWFIDLIKNPIKFWTEKMRWSRCGKKIS